ncbi:MAG: hypothetical protein LQ352_004203 [Teloschistes flavicans]|nr:MAG: hypothetical protein LQ352_004203 [Teloschistes flavicans]
MGTEGNWGQPIVALTAFFLAIVILVLALRIFTRVWIVHAFWWDDFTIILAVLGTTIGAALDFVEVHYGFGKHQRFLTPYDLRQFKKYTYGEWIQTFATLMWTKVSICLFLIRIPQSRALKRPLQWVVAFLLFSNTILTVLLIMQCQPIHAAWDIDADGRCLSLSAKEGIVLTQAVISVVSDFSFAALPIFFLWRTQIDFKTKIGLWVLMGLGFITGVFCLVRTVINNQSFPDDESYGGIVNWVWRLFEVSIGIIAACVPTLKPFFPWAIRRWKGGNGSMDRNIKFPLSDKPQPWLEDAAEAKHSRRQEEKRIERSPLRGSTVGHNGHPPEGRRDTLGEELVKEGIINTNKPTHVIMPPSASEQHKKGTALDPEMHKYGIDDSIV